MIKKFLLKKCRIFLIFFLPATITLGSDILCPAKTDAKDPFPNILLEIIKFPTCF